MMINGIFNRIGITNNNLRLMACKMLCMCFIISTLAFAQRSSVINNTSARNNHLESGIVLPAPIGDLNGSNASRTACFSHGMTNSNWITGFWGPDSGSTEPPTFAALHSFSPGPMELEEAIIHGYYSTDDTTTARAQVFIGVADINGTTIETIASDIIYFNIGEEGPWTTASIDLSGATYYSTDSTFLKLVWSPLDDGYSSLFDANLWIPGQRIDNPNNYAPNGLSGWDSAGVYFPSDSYNYVMEICGTPSNITMAGIEIEEVEAYPGDDVQVGIFFDGQGQTSGTFTGEYYNGSTGGSPDFGELVLVREDFEINFGWGNGSPDPLVQNDGFQVRWTGTIYAEETGTYYFRSYTDDGLRLFIDEQPVIDEWWDFPATNHYGQIDLDPGLHDLEMEYYENGGGAVAQLYWIPPNGVETLVEPSDQVALNSAEFQFDGFQDFDVDFTGISLEGTQLGDLGWAVEFNNTESMLYVALAGADGINMEDLSTLFWLEFHVHDDAMFGDIPIDFVGGILNTESPMWDVEPGGIWVMDPNQPPSAFNLLSPGNGSTLSITPDNVQDVLTFSWEPSIDPEGDQVEYMFATIPSFVVGNDTVTPGFGFVNMGNMLGAAVPYSALIDTMTSYGVESVVLEWGVAATDGNWITGISFGNEDSYVEVEHNDNLNFGSDDFSLSLWFRYWGFFDDNQFTMQLLAKHDDQENQYELQLDRLDENWDSEALLRCYIGGDTFASDIELRTGALYHAVLSRQNGVVSMFINGEMAGMMNSSSNASATSSLYLGYDNLYENEGLQGGMSNVIIFERGLSETEVGVLFDEGNGINNELLFEGAPNDLTSSRVSHWPFNNDYGVWSFLPVPVQSQVDDEAGGGNTALLNNVYYDFGSTNDSWLWNNEVPWVLYIDLSELSTDNIHMPLEFTLHQNYPNPFNPITSIRYDLPNAGNVSLVIYDMMGHQIKQLISGTEDAGRKSVVWDSTNDYGKPVSAGVYMYRIQTGEYIQTKKMVLLK